MKRILILSVLLCLMLLIGCTQQTPPANNPPAPNQTPPANATPPANNTLGDNTSVTPPPPPQPPAQNVSLDQLYKFGSVNSYTYRITSASGGPAESMDLTTSISADTLNGVAVWLEQTDVSTQGTTMTTKMWIDKTTYECLNITTVITYGEQNIEQAGQCPTSGPNSASTGETAPPLTYMGKESVSVPAGTYVADKYTAGGITYWSSSSVPVPLKFVYADGSATMELVSYT
ncbi:MAG: hypothetical protein NT130_05335 [Candidatus Micrarchaeota archaeon]|nr:hypothetical protein [Candidatus Micrarchaeota archaeon]